MSELASYIDHTAPDATRAAGAVVREAAEHQFSVCVNGSRVEPPIRSGRLRRAGLHRGWFPARRNGSRCQALRNRSRGRSGDEIDMVMNVGRFKDGEHDYIVREIRDVVEAAMIGWSKSSSKPACLPTTRCQGRNLRHRRRHFVKTSTGFGNAGATPEHVRLMRETVYQFAGVKAAGGVRNATKRGL